MRAKPIPLVEHARVRMYSAPADGNNGLFQFVRNGQRLKVITSDGRGWEHVSVSKEKANPTWNEMVFIKDMFWGPEETVVQFHPAQSVYVNMHPHCLHLWKKTGEDLQLPPQIMV